METAYPPYLRALFMSTFGQYGKQISYMGRQKQRYVETNQQDCLLILLYLSVFNDIREHDNHATLPLIHHLPEVTNSGLHRCLGNDEPLALFVALNKMCVANITVMFMYIAAIKYVYLH